MSVNDSVVEKVISAVASTVTKSLGITNDLSKEVAEVLAKDIGFIKSNKGRSGGFAVTEAGLQYVGVSKVEYETQVTKESEIKAIERKIANLQKKKMQTLNTTDGIPVQNVPAEQTSENPNGFDF